MTQKIAYDANKLPNFLGQLWDDALFYDHYVANYEAGDGSKPLAQHATPEQILAIEAAIAYDTVILNALGWPVNVVTQDGTGGLPYIETSVPM